MQAMKSSPWDLRATSAVEKVEFGEAVPREGLPEELGPPLARRLKITRQVLQAHGYTENCPQCEHHRAFGENKNGLPHTEACRARIVRCMEESEEGAARLRDEKLRLERSTALRQGDVPPPDPHDTGVRGGTGLHADEVAAETPFEARTARDWRGYEARQPDDASSEFLQHRQALAEDVPPTAGDIVHREKEKQPHPTKKVLWIST